MNSIDLVFDYNRSLSAYRRFFDFNKKNQLDRCPIVWVLLSGAILLLIGLIFSVDIFTYLGAIILLMLLIVISYIVVKFELLFNLMETNLKKSQIESELEFVFSFDEERIVRESKNFSNSIKWGAFKGYLVNENEIYIYYKNDELFDIISQGTIGVELYLIFVDITKTKLKSLA